MWARVDGMLLVDDDERVPGSADEAERLLTASIGAQGLLAIDAAILAAVRPRWMKVARIVHDAIEAGGYSTDDAHVAVHVRRIVALVDAGRLEAQGNLLRPRFSEVRLAGGTQ
jgi:hypothetical protein